MAKSNEVNWNPLLMNEFFHEILTLGPKWSTKTCFTAKGGF